MSEIVTRQHVLNITVIVNADQVIDSCSEPSTDPRTPVSVDNSLVQIIVVSGDVIAGSDTDDLYLPAQPGDYINWFGLSDSGNFGSEIVLYEVTHVHGMRTLSPTVLVQLDAATMQPPFDYPQSEPTEQQVPIWYVVNVALCAGKETCRMQFALYARSQSGAMELYGYFQWEQAVVVGPDISL